MMNDLREEMSFVRTTRFAGVGEEKGARHQNAELTGVRSQALVYRQVLVKNIQNADSCFLVDIFRRTRDNLTGC